MFSRFVLFAGLTAMLVCINQADARPRRVVRPVPQTIAVEETPAEAAKERFTQVVYPVADLVVPIPTRANLNVDPLPSRSVPTTTRVATSAARMDVGLMPGIVQVDFRQVAANSTLEEQLMNLVVSTVAPKSWNQAGGQGTMQYFPLGHSLVVNQTPAVHEEIEDILKALRRLQDVENVLEVRIVQASPQSVEKARRALKLTCQDVQHAEQVKTEKWISQAKGETWTAPLKASEAARLLKLLQRDPTCTVTQAPKITMFNGQIAALEVCDQRCLQTGADIAYDDGEVRIRPKSECFTTGMRLAMKPVASADRKAMTVEMNGYWSAPSGPVVSVPVQTTLKRTDQEEDVKDVFVQSFLQKPVFSQVRIRQKFTAPDGDAVLINAGVVPVETPCDDCASWFVEFLTGRRLTSSAERCVLFLVTPRVIVNEEEEQ
jgi:general secretion pathway protein D